MRELYRRWKDIPGSDCMLLTAAKNWKADITLRDREEKMDLFDRLSSEAVLRKRPQDKGPISQGILDTSSIQLSNENRNVGDRSLLNMNALVSPMQEKGMKRHDSCLEDLIPNSTTKKVKMGSNEGPCDSIESSDCMEESMEMDSSGYIISHISLDSSNDSTLS